MPWWAWLLVDIAIVLAAFAVVVRAGWQFWRRIRTFLAGMSAILAEVPRLPRR
ncbi:MAG TPA: hypothetical protein VF288_02520 [Mycobacteriales bacterium]